MKTLGRLAVTFFVLTLVLGRTLAQEQATAGGIPIAEIPPPPPLDLPVIAPANVPETANFFSAGHDDWPPLPFSPYREVNLLSNNVPTYLLEPADRKGGMPFLLFDDRAIVAVETMEAAAQEKEALLRPVSKSKTADATESSEPKTLARGLVPLTDDLQLDIADVTNGIVSLDILNPTSMTNNPVWDVWMALQFSGAPDNWTWIARTQPGQTNMLVTMPSETEAYFRLGATNNDVDGDGILDSWMSQNFAHVTAWASDHTLATNDFDGDGYDNATAFGNGTSPNILRATTRFPSLFVNQRTVSGTCAVEQGVPFYIAVLVDSTNAADAAWSYYTSSNFSVTLPDADGNHQVRVLLRGHAPGDVPVFDDMEITLDRVAPFLMITNPISASATVTKPYLQLLGNANEPLSVLTYDITNATGWRTNLPVSVIDQAFDTNAFDFTTNYFQAFDVALATNANYLTLRVTDRAGNTTTTNLSVTLDYAGATNPPTMQMTWPTNGMVLSGDTFYVRGQLGDETASMVAQIVDGGGITNEYSGIVERNGTFWVAGLALGAGTNTVQFIATDAAGNVTQDMLNLIKSDLALNITSTPDGESLYDGFGTVSGTVGESGCSVSVNGVAATMSGTDWTAENVPILGLGTAIFDIVATPASGPAAHLSLEKDKPAIIKVTKHFLKQAITAPTYTDTWLKEVRLWADDTGGMRRFRYRGTASRIGTAIYPDGDYNYITDYAWSDTNAAGIAITTFGSGGSVTGAISSPFVMTAPDQQLDHTEGNWPYADYAFYVYHYYAKGVRHEWAGTLGSTVETLAARTEETLFTGGKSGSGETLYCLSSWGYGYGKPESLNWTHTPNWEIESAKISILGHPLDAEGKLWCLVADNSKAVVTTKAEGQKDHSANISKGGIKLSLESLTFQGNGYHDIIWELLDELMQSGAPYSKPHWLTNRANHSVSGNPALYVSGSSVETKTVFLQTGGGSPVGKVVVKGVVSGGTTAFTLRGTNNAPTGNRLWEVTAYADKPLTNKVDYFKPMTIAWSYAGLNEQKFTSAGTSTNPIYVSLGDPSPSILVHTVAHIACEPAVGMSSESNIFEAIWTKFPSLSVPRHNGDAMGYWLNEEEPNYDTFELVLHADGACGAWARLFLDAQKVHGFTNSVLMGIYPPTGYAELGITNMPAQGNTHPKTNFTDHAVVERAGAVYDPSYGKKYGSRLEWEDASVMYFFRLANGETPTNDTKQVLETIWTPVTE